MSTPTPPVGWFVDDPARLYRRKHRDSYAYWDGKRPEPGRLPGRGALDPLDIPELLPVIWLVDVVRLDAGVHFRTRLSGTLTVDLYGTDPTGLWFEELYAEPHLSRQLATYRAVAAAGRAHCTRLRVPMEDREHQVYDRLILPLAEDGATVDMLLGCHAYDPEPGEDPAAWPAVETVASMRSEA
jgi:hypothetical protein